MKNQQGQAPSLERVEVATTPAQARSLWGPVTYPTRWQAQISDSTAGAPATALMHWFRGGSLYGSCVVASGDQVLVAADTQLQVQAVVGQINVSLHPFLGA